MTSISETFSSVIGLTKLPISLLYSLQFLARKPFQIVLSTVPTHGPKMMIQSLVLDSRLLSFLGLNILFAWSILVSSALDYCHESKY